MTPRPLFRRKLIRRSLRRPVTVCIAAVAEWEDIVTVTDKKLSKGFYSSENVSIKTQSLVGDWAAMLSGKIEQFQGFLPVFHGAMGNNFCPRLDDIAASLTTAYQKFAQQLGTEKILGKFDLDVPTFLKRRPELGDALYERLFLELSKVEVEFDLLVLAITRSTRAFSLFLTPAQTILRTSPIAMNLALA